jgi:uncharacterized protein YebE (UPF0316 family)
MKDVDSILGNKELESVEFDKLPGAILMIERENKQIRQRIKELDQKEKMIAMEKEKLVGSIETGY